MMMMVMTIRKLLSRSIYQLKKLANYENLLAKLAGQIVNALKKEKGCKRKKSDKQRNEMDDKSSDIKIPYLQKKRRYKQATKKFSGQGDYVLGKLLTNAAFISALQRDRIFATGIIDEQLIEDEANAVAAKATVSLRVISFGLRKAAGFQSVIENDHADTEKPSFSGAASLKNNFFFCEL
ncbi:hypothetical protein QQG55_55115 [Brugia pahangi]